MTEVEERQKLLAFAIGIARDAGEIMRDYFYRADQGVTTKADSTLVTEADKRINELVIECVNEHYPEHGVLGEEASIRTEKAALWVCDPIDGTNSFTIGEPVSVFSLAFVQDGRPVVAVTFDPYQDMLHSAVLGQGAMRNGERIRASNREISSAVVAGAGSFSEIDRLGDYYRAIRDAGARVRMYGGIVFKGNLVASGRIEGFIFPHRGAHDIAAIKLIVEEAGGKVTDVDGHDQQYNKPIRGAIVSNGIIHGDLLRAVQQFGVDVILSPEV